MHMLIFGLFLAKFHPKPANEIFQMWIPYNFTHILQCENYYNYFIMHFTLGILWLKLIFSRKCHHLLSGRQNGTVQIESEKTRFWAKLMKLECRITLFLFTPRKHQGYESISKFDELFEKQHHLSKLLN